MIAVPITAKKSDLTLQACGDYLLFREVFPAENSATESRWNLPKVRCATLRVRR